MQTFQIQLNKKLPALSHEMPFETAMLRYLMVAVVAVAFSYLYFVSASVMNVIAQKEASQASTRIESDIGMLEARYFSLSQEVTRDQAAKLGLTPVSDSSFVYRLDTVGVAPTSRNAI